MSWADFSDDLPSREPPETAADRLARHLALQLPGLVERRVPVRGLTPGPVNGVGRLRLADSSTFLISSADPGDLGRLARALHSRNAITLARWERTDRGLLLTLAGVPGREPLQVWLLGLDQPD